MVKFVNTAIIAILLSACATSAYSVPTSAQSQNSLFGDGTCKTKPVKEILYIKNGITHPRYLEDIEDYIETYQCGDFNENFELQVTTLLEFITIGHTMSLVPVFPLSSGGKSRRMSNIQNRLYQEAKSIYRSIQWDQGTITADHIASIHEFACESDASIGEDQCLETYDMFLEIGTKLYPYERQKLVQDFFSSIKRFE